MRFKKVADSFEELEKTSSNNKMMKLLSELFEETDKDDIDMVAYFCLGRIASEYEDIDMGVAEKMAMRAIAEAMDREDKEVKKSYNKKGDLGLVAEEFAKKNNKLKVKEVFDKLHEIAKASGKGSQEEKIKILAELLKKSSAKEARYIVRIVLGNLRMGVGGMTVLNALAMAYAGGKEDKKNLEHAYNICPDVGIIAKTAAKNGLKGIKKIDVKVGRPVKMMLAQRVKKIEDIIEKMPGEMAVEEKYDGERIQAHKTGKEIKLFSRKMDDVTHQFPDVVDQIKKNVKDRSFIIEGEVVAVDKKGNLLPFQELMPRRRKHDVEKYVKKIPVCYYLFDLLYKNGKNYIRKTYPKRYKALQSSIKKETKRLQMAKRIVTGKLEEMEEFFNKTIERGGEGVLVKSRGDDSVYRAGTRGWLWIKWKREYAKEMRDTFDLIVVGAFHGKGKRSGTYGSLLCAAYNKKEDVFETVTRLGAGFTDKQLEELPKKFRKMKVSHKPARLKIKKDKIKPDIWLEPEIVVEVLGAELTRSPVHTCAEKDGKGLALRFPRFVKYRKDKKPEQATTSKEIEQMWKKRKGG